MTTVKASLRMDIDGLRAVAVLGVLFYHYGVLWLPGGFTGVDVFFVISGYLITLNLRRDIEAGDFTISGFYDRRLRRIVPAMAVVLLATLVAGWFLLMPTDYAALGASSGYSALGLANFFFFKNTGYFDQASEMQPLLHMWSLGVEEQFYLVWPLVLWLALTLTRSRQLIASVIALSIALGLGYAIYLLQTDPKGAFFLPIPRAWELACGAILVFLPSVRSSAISQSMSLFGAGLVAWSFLAINSSDPFPGINAVFAVAGAALIIWPKRQSAVGSFLSWHPFGWLGLISYSLYLWHWPVLVFFRHYNNGHAPSTTEAIPLAIASIGLAWFSWRYVEKPFRKPIARKQISIFAGATTCAIILALGVTVSMREGYSDRIPDAAMAMSSKQIMWSWNCTETKTFDGLLEPVCIIGAKWDEAREKAFLWGDSHAAHLAPLLAPAARAGGVAIVLYDYCPAMLGSTIARIDTEARLRCEKFNPLGTAFIQSEDIETVLFAGYWDTLPELVTPSENSADVLVAELARTVSGLGRPRQYVLFTDIPTYDDDVSACEVARTGGVLRRDCGVGAVQLPQETYRARSSSFRGALAAASTKGFSIVDLGAALCPRELCTVRVNSEYIYRDSNHLRRNLTPQANSELARITGIDQLFKD